MLYYIIICPFPHNRLLFILQLSKVCILPEYKEYATIEKITNEVNAMCRNIKTLFNFEPPATDDEIYAASLQYVRKVTGFNKVSKANEDAFNQAVEQVAIATQQLLNTAVTTAEPRNREIEAERARARSAKRFGVE